MEIERHSMKISKIEEKAKARTAFVVKKMKKF